MKMWATLNSFNYPMSERMRVSWLLMFAPGQRHEGGEKEAPTKHLITK